MVIIEQEIIDVAIQSYRNLKGASLNKFNIENNRPYVVLCTLCNGDNGVIFIVLFNKA